MKKLYVVGIVALFSFVFIGSGAGNSSSKVQNKSSCPYLNQIQKNHRPNVCPYLNGTSLREIKVTVPPIKFIGT